MPNQRAKNKVYIGGFVDKKLQQKLFRLAKQAGMEKNRFGFAAMMMEESIERRLKRQAAKA